MNLDEEGLDQRGSDKKQQQAVEKFLREYVEELLVNEVDALLTGHSLQPELPQVGAGYILLSPFISLRGCATRMPLGYFWMN